jgi:hypothetical protein
MIGRRDHESKDEDIDQMEIDLIYKFKRLRLDGPGDYYSLKNVQIIKKMDALNLDMAEETSQPTSYSYKGSDLDNSAPKKIKVFDPYDKWLKRERFSFRRMIKPKIKKRWEIIPYKPLDLEAFVFGEIFKQL